MFNTMKYSNADSCWKIRECARTTNVIDAQNSKKGLIKTTGYPFIKWSVSIISITALEKREFNCQVHQETYLYAIEVSKRLLDTKFYNEMFLIT